ncbi:MAG: glycoside hydrolase family 3 C-terminal domain-containing protein, partial [Puniceicoccales bacterium]|nr:glycoside hydrolase family 3 C-terminal domain-containing protein [Puniceicoccales bacterium]
MPPSSPPPYQNASLPIEVRVADLLSRMTLDEKCDQVRQGGLAKLQVFEGAVSSESLERVFRTRQPGFVHIESGATAQTNAIKARDLQEYLLQNSRLGIPPLFVTGGAAGVPVRGATIFPCPLALGATWNAELAREIASRIAIEAAAAGATLLTAPSFALARDPRFGGVSQCFGECPTLATALGLAYLEGLQGENTGEAPGKIPSALFPEGSIRFEGDLPPNKVFGAATYFTGWAVPDGGLLGAPVSLSTRALRALHFPPFEDAVRKGHVQVVTPIISPINSVPGHANEWLLDSVLRKEWNFPGVVLATYGGVSMNATIYGVANDRRDAAAQALTAGVDITADEDMDGKYFADDVRAGLISAVDLDRAVARILRLKFLAGLFEERRIIDPTVLHARIHTAETRALAHRAAAESIILLKNNDGLLPLDTNRIKTLAVIGPNANRSQFGDGVWSREDGDGVTVLQGLRNLLGNKVRIHFSEGCGTTGTSRGGFDEAVAVAKGGDAVLVVLGDESGPPAGGLRTGWRPHSPTAGAGFDVSNPVLPGVQEELLRVIAATGRPVIVLFLHG